MSEPEQPILARTRVLLAGDPDRFARNVFARMFAMRPSLREFFPAEMGSLRSSFVDVLDHVLEAIEAPDGHGELVEFLAQLGRDHRKYGVVSEHYWLMYEALMSEFQFAFGRRWTPEVEETVGQAMLLTTGVMRGAAESAEGPARWQARVVQKFTITRERAVVRLVATGPRPAFAAGQYLETQIPQWPRTWRNLSPSIPPNPQGELEFHVRAVPGGRVSGSIVRDTAVGDVWTFAQQHGTMHIDPNRPALLIAGGTGLAPLRALLIDLARFAEAPPTHVFYGATHPGELYELGVLQQLAATNPWLRITAVAETTEDPWWLTGATDPRRWGVEMRYGRVGEVAAEYADWSDRQVLLSGPAPMVFHTALRLRAAGVDPAAIQHDPLS
ncbi:globin domain-containing protein [Gordonia neofelifaecis]|uniref:nitric oxide dioxygenase n=1 Tax=Gordonia neofelifaecis NRRL B-59395 TaxID=644548 RepID=F1YJN3_9ACTN|nr:globin domain-containing protein [Gordonia neofelifaecis]EGD54965.1 oxidoreductase FAD/NAD(P)-binding domain-containing protein [Gordonia neofelifaecis NRRL B-59395]